MNRRAGSLLLGIIATLSVDCFAQIHSKDYPSIKKELQPGKSKYETQITSQGNVMSKFEVEVSIEKSDSGFVITETASLPIGRAIDRTHIEGKSGIVIQRWIEMGGRKMHLVFEKELVKEPINSSAIFPDLKTTVFADGGGAYEVIGLLPLDNEYKASFYNYNVKLKVNEKMLLEVISEEELTVPAGKFKTWKLELRHEDSPGLFFIWISKDEKRSVIRRRSEHGDTSIETVLVNSEM